MSLGWAGAVTGQHRRIAARRDVILRAKTSQDAAALIGMWEADNPGDVLKVRAVEFGTDDFVVLAVAEARAEG